MPEEPKQADYDARLQALETDVRDLTLLFKYLIQSSPQGELLLFATLGRIEEQDQAVLDFNARLKELLHRKGLG
jgi:hypothetical protein